MPPLTDANRLIRSQNVSASEVGALLDGHPYATPEGIWDRLMGQEQPRRESEAMNLGSYFESAILRYAERRDGFRARANGRTITHPSVRLCATPDAFVTPAGMAWSMVPESALVEVKMSGRPELWATVPSYVEWQARAQLAVTRRDVVYIYVLVAMSLIRHEVWRDVDKEVRLLEAVDSFWKANVVAGVRPEPAAPRELVLDFTQKELRT